MRSRSLRSWREGFEGRFSLNRTQCDRGERDLITTHRPVVPIRSVGSFERPCELLLALLLIAPQLRKLLLLLLLQPTISQVE